MDRDLLYVSILIILYGILVLFDWRRLFVTTHYKFIHISDLVILRQIVMFEIGIAAPHQIMLDLFWGVRSSSAGYDITFHN